MASLRYQNLRLVIYPNDHGPPHVHVDCPGFEVKENLEGEIRLGPSGRELGPVMRRSCLLAVRINRAELLQIWEELHGAESE
jgi:hypothetical protein